MRKAVSAQGSHGVPTGQGSGGAKHALLAERIRMEHIRKALACAANAPFRERCEAELASSMTRAVEMHCRTLLDVQLSGTAAAAIDEASFFERSH